MLSSVLLERPCVDLVVSVLSSVLLECPCVDLGGVSDALCCPQSYWSVLVLTSLSLLSPAELVLHSERVERHVGGVSGALCCPQSYWSARLC